MWSTHWSLTDRLLDLIEERGALILKILKIKKRKVYGGLLSVMIAGLVAASGVFVMPVEAAVSAATTLGDVLTVGVPKDRCPGFYEDEKTGEVTGIGVDVMRLAAEDAGYDVTFKVIEEPTLKEALDNPEYGVVMPFGGAVPSASGANVVLSDDLLQMPFTLVTAGERTLPPFNRIHVGMHSSLGGGAETVQKSFPGIEISMYDTMDDCVKALRTGEVDALLHNSYVWSYVLQKPSYSDLVVQPTAMFAMDFRVGAIDSAAGRAVIERLNKGIASVTDTQKQAIIMDHTYRRLYKYTFFDYVYRYGLAISLLVLFFVSLIVITILKSRNLRLMHEESMRQLLYHDPLTGVLSLEGFRVKVEELLQEHPDIPYLFAYSNIKDFKYINDSMGINTGDELLKFWADSLKNLASDVEAVCRPEDDHFVMLRRMVSEKKMISDEKEFLGAVRNYFIDRGGQKQIQVCSGMYVLTQEDYKNINVDHMLDLARMAEKRVRDQRNDGYEIYNPSQWEKGKRNADIIGHLPAGIKAGEIEVWYQPQVDYKNKKIVGAEALCRWNHERLGFLAPDEFIPVLEGAGIMYDLDSYVWDVVCQDIKRWNDQGIRRSISVNLSQSDIREDRNIPGHFFNLVTKYGIDFDQLRVEITETAYANNAKLLLETTENLRNFGFKVEMDDFGSGYSSLNMLKEVNVDRIKLDLHFLTETGDTKKGHTIVSHIIRMIGALGMDVIAEGVEDESQAEFLLQRGCIEMQGFYFYKPMKVTEFEKLGEK